MRSRLRNSIILVLAIGAAACGASPVRLISGERTPGAQGEVKTKTDANGNNKLTIEVKHLAPPEKVDPSARAYVVWVYEEGTNPQNVGALTVDSDLTGTLETITPLHGFLLMITAEPDAGAREPRGLQVLSGKIND